MAPPPPSSLPLTQRLMKLAETLQFAWFVGHLTLLFSVVRYGLSYITLNYYSRWAKVSYRLAFISAAATYGIVVYKAYRARMRGSANRAPASVLSLVADENVQYLAMALVWLFSSQYPLAMLPFGVYSIFHVATYTRTNLIPTLQPAPASSTSASGASPSAKPPQSAMADTIGKFVKEYYDTSMGLVAGLEVLLWVRLFQSAITFAKGSWILLGIYTIFLRARFAQSSFVQAQFRQLEARIDSVVGGQNTSPAVRSVWEGIKGGAKGFRDATDMGKYVGNQPAPKKTS